MDIRRKLDVVPVAMALGLLALSPLAAAQGSGTADASRQVYAAASGTDGAMSAVAAQPGAWPGVVFALARGFTAATSPRAVAQVTRQASTFSGILSAPSVAAAAAYGVSDIDIVFDR